MDRLILYFETFLNKIIFQDNTFVSKHITSSANDMNDLDSDNLKKSFLGCQVVQNCFFFSIINYTDISLQFRLKLLK